jgi:hypothetical protein
MGWWVLKTNNDPLSRFRYWLSDNPLKRPFQVIRSLPPKSIGSSEIWKVFPGKEVQGFYLFFDFFSYL